MCPRAPSLAVAARLAAASAGFVAAAPKVYRSAEWGLEFAYPDGFAEGRYKHALMPEQRARRRAAGRDSPFADATETGYDRVIESIIATFRTFAPGG